MSINHSCATKKSGTILSPSLVLFLFPEAKLFQLAMFRKRNAIFLIFNGTEEVVFYFNWDPCILCFRTSPILFISIFQLSKLYIEKTGFGEDSNSEVCLNENTYLHISLYILHFYSTWIT